MCTGLCDPAPTSAPSIETGTMSVVDERQLSSTYLVNKLSYFTLYTTVVSKYVSA
jgi:hypothetical protein